MTNNDFIVFYDKDEYDDYLMHYGVLGMKWGVRNKIKSGISNYKKKRLANSEKKKEARALAKQIKAKRKSELKVEKSTNKSEKKDRDSISKKSFKDMSDKELSDRIARLQKEKQYIELNNFVNPTPTKGKEKGFAGKMFDSTKQGIVSGTKGVVETAVKGLGKQWTIKGLAKAFDITEDEAKELIKKEKK